MLTINQTTTSFDQTKISYSLSGSGFPLVLLHGNGGSSSYFKRQIAFFSQHYLVISIDSRDHGRSGNNSKVLNFSQMAQDIMAVLNTEKITNCHLLGFSDGAVLATAVAIAYPKVVNKLVLVAANTRTEGLKAYSLWSAQIGALLTKLLSPFSKKCQQWFRLLSLIVKDSGIKTSQLNQIHIETLVVAGEHDIIKKSHTEYLAHSIPNSQLIIIKKASHNLIQTKAAEFNALVSNFLSSRNQ